MKEPIALPAGTRLVMTAYYDNTTDAAIAAKPSLRTITAAASRLARAQHSNRKRHRRQHVVALELQPDAVVARLREERVEDEVGTAAFGDRRAFEHLFRMRVHVLGHVFAEHHRVAERAEVALQVLHRLAGLLVLEMNRHVGFFAGDELRRLDLQLHASRRWRSSRTTCPASGSATTRRCRRRSRRSSSGVAIICGPPPTGMKSLNSMYWPAAGSTCSIVNEPSFSSTGCSWKNCVMSRLTMKKWKR